jgi:flagellar basal-body rod modification protein FlgD
MAEPINTTATGPFQPVTPSRAAPTAKPGDLFSSETFLKVLGAQMKAQNPLEPLKDTEFIASMTQFSSLEQITKLNATMSSMALGMQLSQGASMIGRSVTYLPEGAVTPVTGTVERLTLEKGGKEMSLIVGGVPVAPSQVVEVAGA